MTNTIMFIYFALCPFVLIITVFYMCNPFSKRFTRQTAIAVLYVAASKRTNNLHTSLCTCNGAHVSSPVFIINNSFCIVLFAVLNDIHPLHRFSQLVNTVEYNIETMSIKRTLFMVYVKRRSEIKKIHALLLSSHN